MKQFLSLTALFLASASFAATPIDETIDADSAQTLDVSNILGSVSVIGTVGDAVRIQGSLADEAEALDVRREGSRIVVHVIYPQSGRRFGANEGTVLEITAPPGLDVSISTVSARITLGEMRGEQRLESVSGSIETTVFDDEVSAMTTSGRIAIHGNDANTRAAVSSVSGRVELAALGGEVNAQTVSGSIELRSGGLDRAELKSVSGSISVEAALTGNGRINAVTTSGRISLDLNGSPAGAYELATLSGSIDNCFGPEVARPQFGPPSSTLRFEETDANTQVFVNSMSGSIEICK
ncbi:MAG TPA: DUF4097 family beta strand repeat-containing protein [Gammaproteobacteria bacterium]|nr:DUF4097 family beta strand repeat-containing protein [Gammaproteobacteria bacterium]